MKIFIEENLIDEIISEAIYFLEEFGIFVESPEVEALLIENGCTKEGERIKLKRDNVLNAIKKLPEKFLIFNREGEPFSIIGEDNVHFVPGSAALDYLKEGRLEVAKTQDFINFSILVDYLPYYSFQSTAIVCSDVPFEIADFYRLYICLEWCKKPVVTGVFRKESLPVMKSLLMIFRENEKEFIQKPFAIFDVCPSPPLKWSALSCETIKYLSINSIPIEFVSMPSPGATAPVTLFDAISIHVAENLSGAYISYLYNPLCPVIAGGSPAPLDMRFGTFPIGSIESAIMNIYAVKCFKKLGLPTHAYMGLSDSKVIDYQSGGESTMGIILATLSGINVVSGGGMLNFEKAQSIEKLILDHEICMFAKKIKERIEKKADVKEVIEVLLNKGSILSHPHTRKWYRKELTFPKVFSKEDEERWAILGRKDSVLRAEEFFKKILESHNPSKCNEKEKQELDKIVKKFC